MWLATTEEMLMARVCWAQEEAEEEERLEGVLGTLQSFGQESLWG